MTRRRIGLLAREQSATVLGLRWRSWLFLILSVAQSVRYTIIVDHTTPYLAPEDGHIAQR